VGLGLWRARMDGDNVAAVGLNKGASGTGKYSASAVLNCGSYAVESTKATQMPFMP